jgi:hypothetical protein
MTHTRTALHALLGRSRGELGTVTNAFMADATFTCERAGTSDVTLLVSDGACPSTAYVTVTCTAP